MNFTKDFKNNILGNYIEVKNPNTREVFKFLDRDRALFSKLELFIAYINIHNPCSWTLSMCRFWQFWAYVSTVGIASTIKEHSGTTIEVCQNNNDASSLRSNSPS